MFSNIHYDDKQRGIRFDLKGVDVAYAIAIRRVIYADIPNVAIGFDSTDPSQSDITFIANKQALHNEFMAHRLSLIPVCLSIDEIEELQKEKENHTPRFVINVENTDSPSPILVTTKDIKLIGDIGSSSGIIENIFPTDKFTNQHVILTKLKKGEHMHVEFTYRLGKAMTHARWCPVSTCVYYNTLDDVKVKEARAKLTAEDDMNKFETLDKWRIFNKNEFNEPNEFSFTIESECSLTPVYLVGKAIDILIQKLQRLLIPGVLVSEVVDKDTMMYAIYVDSENHTIGNLLQTTTYNNFVRVKTGLPQHVSYIGYFEPHPLKSRIVFKIRLTKSEIDPISFMQASSRETIKFLEDMKRQWIAATSAKNKAKKTK